VKLVGELGLQPVELEEFPEPISEDDLGVCVGWLYFRLERNSVGERFEPTKLRELSIPYDLCREFVDRTQEVVRFRFHASAFTTISIPAFRTTCKCESWPESLA